MVRNASANLLKRTNNEKELYSTVYRRNEYEYTIAVCRFYEAEWGM